MGDSGEVFRDDDEINVKTDHRLGVGVDRQPIDDAIRRPGLVHHGQQELKSVDLSACQCIDEILGDHHKTSQALFAMIAGFADRRKWGRASENAGRYIGARSPIPLPSQPIDRRNTTTTFDASMTCVRRRTYGVTST